ncbi:MAG: TatD family hydrolase [Patescibacteria group bacterium]|jgi:TatD DNase family protein|nr:TatD family hydrolase [Patescibacteria group bacterium]
MFIDTHCHVNFKDFKEDADEVIRRALDNNTSMIIVSSDIKTANKALALANKYESGVHAAIGLHPTNIEFEEKHNSEGLPEVFVSEGEYFDYGSYEKLANSDKVVAIGEIGLDYYHIDPKKDVAKIKKRQQEVFIQQLILARNLDLPVIIHCRQAHDDLYRILSEFKKDNPDLFTPGKNWGVVHCFSGDEDLAWKYFSLGLLISFTGLITFSKQWDDLIRKVPFDKIMIETDTPFMTPEPYRGRRNEPLLVQYVAKRIADIKNIKIEKVAEVTYNNAQSLFDL